MFMFITCSPFLGASIKQFKKSFAYSLRGPTWESEKYLLDEATGVNNFSIQIDSIHFTCTSDSTENVGTFSLYCVMKESFVRVIDNFLV